MTRVAPAGIIWRRPCEMQTSVASWIWQQQPSIFLALVTSQRFHLDARTVAVHNEGAKMQVQIGLALVPHPGSRNRKSLAVGTAESVLAPACRRWFGRVGQCGIRWKR
ncbi:predicted protein [Chaetomium globosum CBS 148.51]|uniref:Uncharacterized protein n=1 Tax=Chaetomium globosum (strain ATCC 6205 / CBS 148.51 / DSM 1962 / NBRC 6347 / NRRL 1970) TaxID=306901 RepID=Q2HE17_CHAGB|nr:uncharacterized protein CHGG_01537 [Chaetomium globosum CBS 148.51]EAQ93302.1 predicted protein [Chaetomium globosum CBS 148.51]